MFMTLSEYLMESGMKVMLHMAVDPQFAVCSSTNVVSLYRQGHNCCARNVAQPSRNAHQCRDLPMRVS